MLIRFTCFPRVANGGPPASVQWHTADVTAIGGFFPDVTEDDYFIAGNVPGFPVTFQPGVGEQNGIITTVPDDCLENDETFRIVLTTPVNAFLQRGVATFTLRNEDTTCRDPITGTLLDSCLCNGFFLGTVDAIPAEAATTVGASLPYGIQWTVPSPASWRSLQSMDIRLTEQPTGESADHGHGGSGPDDAGVVLTVRWDEAANTFSMLDPLTGALIRSGQPGSHTRFETPLLGTSLQFSDVVGSGPTGPSVVLTLDLSFKPQAAGRVFNVDVSSTADSGSQQGYTRAGTITVLPH